MLLRPLTADDAAQCALIHSLCDPEPWKPIDFLELIGAPYHHGWGIGTVKIEGFLLAQIVPPCAEIILIAVHPQRQRFGYGQFLMATLALHAQEVILEVNASNAQGIQFYQTLGFVEVGKRADYYKVKGQSFHALILGKKS